MSFDVIGDNGSFSISSWGWRPILQLLSEEGYEVPRSWHFNDGDGLDTREECNELAGVLRGVLERDDSPVFYMESDMRVDESTGRFLERGSGDGVSAYSVDRERLVDFITFLERCDGSFKIW